MIIESCVDLTTLNNLHNIYKLLTTELVEKYTGAIALASALIINDKWNKYIVKEIRAGNFQMRSERNQLIGPEIY